MEEGMAELDQVKDQLRKSKMANRQQHHLVVEWKIKVFDIENLQKEQNATLTEQAEELEKRSKHISDLKTTAAQLTQDVKKTQSMLNQSNQQLTEYVEKYTRQVVSPKIKFSPDTSFSRLKHSASVADLTHPDPPASVIPACLHVLNLPCASPCVVQTAYVKQQEGMWKAMQAKNRLALASQVMPSLHALMPLCGRTADSSSTLPAKWRRS